MIARLDDVVRRPFPLLLVSAVFGIAACGSGDDSASDGDDGGGAAGEGREIAEDNGCMSCHRAGGGGVGPDWEGLAGSTVTLDDGATVVADEAYLALSITDPGAQIVDGYDIRMPASDLDDDDVAAIVAYIQSLGTTSSAVTGEPTT